MKTIVWMAAIALLVVGLTGCQCMRNWHGCHVKKGASMTENSACAKCGLPRGKCKCPSGPTMIPEINTAALKTLIDSGATLTLLDARTGKYDDGRRIPGALSLAPDAKDEAILAMLKSKDALIVTYCANLKCPASVMLADKLQALGYKHILEYPYGIEGWAAEGNPVTPAAK
ncbi:MAG: rhodanese-like domain-containing protein [Kiritimatiellia bacterium]|jgi:rhodanese-related sulfurtransferase